MYLYIYDLYVFEKASLFQEGEFQNYIAFNCIDQKGRTFYFQLECKKNIFIINQEELKGNENYGYEKEIKIINQIIDNPNLQVIQKYLFDFYQEKQSNVLRVEIKNQKDDKAIREFMEKNENLQSSRIKMQNEIAFVIENNLKSSGWIYIENLDKSQIKQQKKGFDKFSINFDYVLSISLDQIKCDNQKDSESFPPMRICSFDIEVTSFSGQFPKSFNIFDKIVQIGLCFGEIGKDIQKRILINNGQSVPEKSEEFQQLEEQIEFINCDSEEELLYTFFVIMIREDPQILTGYNILGFDEKYIYDRVNLLVGSRCNFYQELQLLSQMLSKDINISSTLIQNNISSKQMGDIQQSYFQSRGLVHIDMFFVLKKSHKTDNYSLNNVYKDFMKIEIKPQKEKGYFKVVNKDNMSIFKKGDMVQLIPAQNFVFSNSKKLLLEEIDFETDLIKVRLDSHALENFESYGFISIQKNDVPYQTIFQTFKDYDSQYPNVDIKVQEKMREIGYYCVKDCEMVYSLINKTNTIQDMYSMSNLCRTPVNFVILSGQTVKISSYIASYADEKNFILKDKWNFEEKEEGKYQGAYVLNPSKGFYQTFINVYDFNSLYPSIMIMFNMSNDTMLKNPEDFDQDFLQNKCYSCKIDGVDSYFVKEEIREGILSESQKNLLAARSKTKKLMEKSEPGSLQYILLNMKQLAIKIVANSIYGQLGSSNSPISMKKIALAITTIGRYQIDNARNVSQKYFKDYVVDIEKMRELFLSKQKERGFNFEYIEETIELTKKVKEYIEKYQITHFFVIYGDTDSIFQNTFVKDINEAQIVGTLFQRFVALFINPRLKLMFEKALFNLLLPSKKKYTAIKYDEGKTKGKASFQGILLAKNDQAKVVKILYWKILETILNQKGDQQSEVCQENILNLFKILMTEMFEGKIDSELFQLSVTLGSGYQNPENMPAFVLSKKIEKRSGEQKKSGEKIQFVIKYDKYLNNSERTKKSELAEDLSYLKQNNLQIDYLIYFADRIVPNFNRLFHIYFLRQEGNLGYIEYLRICNQIIFKEQKKRYVELLEDIYLRCEKLEQELEVQDEYFVFQEDQIIFLQQLLFLCLNPDSSNQSSSQTTNINLYQELQQVKQINKKGIEKYFDQIFCIFLKKTDSYQNYLRSLKKPPALRVYCQFCDSSYSKQEDLDNHEILKHSDEL